MQREEADQGHEAEAKPNFLTREVSQLVELSREMGAGAGALRVCRDLGPSATSRLQQGIIQHEELLLVAPQEHSDVSHRCRTRPLSSYLHCAILLFSLFIY